MRIIRSCVDLPRGDPRGPEREERFLALSAKRARRAAYRRMFMEDIDRGRKTVPS